MKKKLHISLLFLFLTICATAQTFDVGELRYTVTSVTNVSVGKINDALNAVTIPATVDNAGTTYTVTSIADQGFMSSNITSVIIPNTVTSIGNDAFLLCSLLTSVTIPNSVTTIGNQAFQGCTGLTTVTLPNSVNILGVNVFRSCTNLASITLSNSLTEIPNRAFMSCSSLTSITIPNLVTSIGSSAFRASGLTSINLPNSVITIGDEAFNDCSALTSINIPNSVTSIGALAFRLCTSLTSATIPSSVTTISNGLFIGCSNLTSVTLPNTLTTIGFFAFAYSGLTSINIPSSVTLIDQFAFQSCTGLTSVTVNWNTPLIINANVFDLVTTSNIPLNVPMGTQSLYEADAVWTIFMPITGFLSTDSFDATTKLVVYPNPSNGIFNLEMDQNASYEIFDIVGKQLKSGKINLGTSQIDVSNYNSGIYLLKITNETNQTKTLRLIKQ